MPWHQEPKKDVTSCDKPRGAANKFIRGFPNGETRMVKNHTFCTEYIGTGGEPAEVKHLSRQRKRKKIDSVSRGDRKRKSLNQGACTLGFGLQRVVMSIVEEVWKIPPKRVIVP